MHELYQWKIREIFKKNHKLLCVYMVFIALLIDVLVCSLCQLLSFYSHWDNTGYHSVPVDKIQDLHYRIHNIADHILNLFNLLFLVSTLQ